jgi:small redox-active disulfide protein 2
MIIKVFGSGCSSCQQLYVNAKEATNKFGSNIDVMYITDMNQIMASGIMHMPALVINNKVKSTGRVLTVNEIYKYIEEEKSKVI